MSNRQLGASRTVLISSRIDELGSSRRAAFRAVHDEGWIPLLYEIEPDEWLTTDPSVDPDVSRAELYANSLNVRFTMEKLLRKAEYFIGVYGTSLGDPNPQLSNLRPLEFEILQFLKSRASPFTQSAALKEGGDDNSPPATAGARQELKDALEQVRKRDGPYHVVFDERVALFLKTNATDVPASSLMYSTLYRLQHCADKSHVQFFCSKSSKLPTGYTIYRRPSADLYRKVREQIRFWKDRDKSQLPPRIEAARWIFIPSSNEVGVLLRAVKVAFYSGFNVIGLRMGAKKNGLRGIYMRVIPFLRADDNLVGTLKDKHDYKARLCRRAPPRLTANSSDEQMWRLTTVVANRPGMLVRVLTVLALYGMRLLNVTIGRGGSSKGTAKGRLAKIKLTFERGCGDLDYAKDLESLIMNDAQVTLDFIAAELTSLPGFYSVTPPLWLRRRRKTKPTNKRS